MDDATRMTAPFRRACPDGTGAPGRRRKGATPAGPGVAAPPPVRARTTLPADAASGDAHDVGITVFLADDNVIVREGVRALLSMEPDLEIVGVAGDYDELLAGATEAAPQVLVTDIRMPPTFQQEGIDAAKELRRRHPGTGIVVLSQYDDPEYAVALLSDGAAGYAYLLKDRIAEGNQLARTVREVAAGGSVLDPTIVEAIVSPVSSTGGLSAEQERLLKYVAEGRPIKAIAVAEQTTPGRDRAGGRAALHHVVRGSQDRGIRRAAPAPAPAPGHRRPGGAGRDAQPPPPDRRGRQGPRRRRPDRRDRGAHGHGADVRRPRLLGDRRAVGSRARSRASSTSTAPA